MQGSRAASVFWGEKNGTEPGEDRHASPRRPAGRSPGAQLQCARCPEDRDICVARGSGPHSGDRTLPINKKRFQGSTRNADLKILIKAVRKS